MEAVLVASYGLTINQFMVTVSGQSENQLAKMATSIASNIEKSFFSIGTTGTVMVI